MIYIMYKKIIFVFLSTFMTAPLIAKEYRCGWLLNPTPANFYFIDKEGEWGLSEQGMSSPLSDQSWDNMPESNDNEFVRINGNYGFSCVCLNVKTNKKNRRILEIYKKSKSLLLKRCLEDRELPNIYSANKEEYLKVDRVSDVLEADFNGDGQLDKAILVSDDYLYLYFGDSKLEEEKGEMKQVLSKSLTDFMQIVGQKVSLKTNNKGSLIIQSEHRESASLSSETIILAYRHKQFVVAGYRYQYEVVRDPTARQSCDINFLNRKGKHNGTAFTIAKKAVKASDWTRDVVPKQCRFEK